MTEFKRTVANVDEIHATLAKIKAEDAALDVPARAALLQSVESQVLPGLDGEDSPLAVLMEKFSRRLTEKDPVSGDFRYGEGMREKVAALRAQYDEIAAALPATRQWLDEELRAHDLEKSHVNEQQRLQRIAEREAMEAQARGAQKLEELKKAEAAKKAGLLEQERLRVAADAQRSREEKAAALEEAERVKAEAKAARKREAAAVAAAVTSGVAGVDAGICLLREAIGSDAAQKRVTCTALHQILHNVASNPEDLRFRRIRCGNERFHADVGRYEGAVQVLLASGFKIEVGDEENEEVLVMHEPDLRQNPDAWSHWYNTIKAAVTLVQSEAGHRPHHGGLMG